MSGWHHNNANWKEKECVVCAAVFVPRSGVHKFCSLPCKGKWKYITGESSTENQYKAISGNWTRYFERLRGKTYRKNLSTKDLLTLLEKQEGRCAISGVVLTCVLEKGKKCKTNASIDRIEAGKEYSLDNVQLVCSALNSWRGDTDLQEFINFCKQVAKWQERGGK